MKKINFIIRKARRSDFDKFVKVDKEAWHNTYIGVLDYYDRTEKRTIKSIKWDKDRYFHNGKEGKLSIFVADSNGEILG